MGKDKNFSRRNFVKSSIAVAGFGMIGTVPVLGADYHAGNLGETIPIPLNDILSDYWQVEKIYGKGLINSTISNKESWESKKLNIQQRLRLMLGEAPPITEDVIKPVVLSEIQREGFRQLKVQFPSGTGDTIKGFLLIPDGTVASVPRPAIMALHSTGPGASQTVGLVPKENRCYGMELAQRGYVVLATDVISAGERIYPGYEEYYTNEFYKEFPHWSAMGKMVYDYKKGLDYLCSLDIVDPDRLGCIGHSLGGYNSYFLQAFDSRIKAAVSSCGFSPMGGTNNPYIFARNDWFVHFNPICREYIRSGMIPCDMHEVMALCAPRPFFNYSAKQDKIYAFGSDFTSWWNTSDKALNQVSGVYEVLDSSGNFTRVENVGGHDFPPDVRKESYLWLDKLLGME